MQKQDVKYVKKIDMITLVLISLLFAYWMVALLYPSIFNPVAGLYFWMLDIAEIMGYPGAFLASFLGNATIILPVPYLAVAFILGGVKDPMTGLFIFDPLLIGIISGLAATTGEITGYLIGTYTSKYVPNEKTNGFLRFANGQPRIMPIILFLLAATPVPDDFLIVPLGMAEYPLHKIVVPQIIGKSIFLLAVAYAGRFGLAFVDSFIMSNPYSFASRTIEVLGLTLLVLMMYAVLKYDWESAIGARLMNS